MSARYKAELADGLGNLASRVTSMVGRYSRRPPARDGRRAGARRARWPPRSRRRREAAIDRIDLQGAILAAMDYVRVVNVYVTEQEPWKVAKDDVDAARATSTGSSTPPPRRCAPSPCCSTR